MKAPKEKELTWYGLVAWYLLTILACIGILSLFAETPTSLAPRDPEETPVAP